MSRSKNRRGDLRSGVSAGSEARAERDAGMGSVGSCQDGSGRGLVVLLLAAALLFVACTGCHDRRAAVEETPFREAIERYLKAHNMALAIKEIKEGPRVEEQTATLQASLVHQELGGPSVTWTFHFARQTDGSWLVERHED
jgi:hypothetical protein